MDYYTQTDGERPDLAVIEVNPPENYIGTKILPVANVTVKTGAIYYATVSADATAATSRAAGTGPVAVQIAPSTTSFTAIEWITRGGIVPDEVKAMGGIEKADVVGAKYAKRNAMNALEADICSNILGTAASDTWDAAKVLVDTQTALESVRRYEGKTALIAGTATLKRMVQQMLGDDTVGPIFSRLISGVSPLVAIQGMNFESWKAGLAMYLGIDMVLAGDDAIWGTTTYDGHYAIAKIDDGMDELSHKYKPVLGKTYMFLPDGVQPYSIQTVADRVDMNSLYTCAIWFDAVILNSDALYVVDGVSA